jgi:hypothetical protein
MKQIVVYPRGQLSDKDRRALARAGVAVVEADDPSKVVMVLPMASVQPNEMLAIALESMQASGTYADASFKAFVAKFAKAVRDKLP